MTIKIIDAEDRGTDGYAVRVDLDAANTADPSTDPKRLLDLVYGSYETSKNAGETKSQYLQRVKTEVQIMARFEQNRRYSAPVPATKLNAIIGNDIT